MTPDPRHEGGEPNQLAELLACELELAGLLAEAQAEARRLVEEARTGAGRAEAEMEASLAGEAESVRARIRQETQASVRGISARAAAGAAVFEGIPGERVERLAEAAFRRLIGAEDPT